MNATGREILEHLATVERLRQEHRADPPLLERVNALKSYQAQRFSRSYADLLQHPRYRAATTFFLEELYGPQEFGARDTQFARVVPALVRMFPEDIVRTVSALAALHALSESLDSAMARHLPTARLGAADYVRAWQAVGLPGDRQQQVKLTLKIGFALDRYTRNPLLRTTLRMMRKPAAAAGLGDLQRFLETGFDTFGAMRGASEFLETIERRELALIDALFVPGVDSLLPDQIESRESATSSLRQLP
jgi:hypothetical protein